MKKTDKLQRRIEIRLKPGSIGGCKLFNIDDDPSFDPKISEISEAPSLTHVTFRFSDNSEMSVPMMLIQQLTILVPASADDNE